MKYKIYEKISKMAREEFKIWLAKNNITQSQFAAQCGYSRQYLSQIITGKCRLTEKIVRTIRSQGCPLRAGKIKKED